MRRINNCTNQKSIINKVLILSFALIIIVIICLSTDINNTSNASLKDYKEINSTKTTANDVNSEKSNINVYFYKLGVKNEDGSFQNAKAEGDSFIIVVGDVEILVDAGADVGSAPAIIEQMRKHVSKDKLWDYIIVTHADKDHIAALGASSLKQSVFKLFLGENEQPEMKLGTLIDFDITQDNTNNYPKKEELFNTEQYKKYCTYRGRLIAEKGVKYYTASQCLWKQRGLSSAPIKGLTNVFVLDEVGTTLNILDNYYCYNKFHPNNQVSSTDRNNLCVCFTIEAINNDGNRDRFLFTGDLEEYDSTTKEYKPIYGESKLLECNPQLKEGVLFYKAGHHGSRTSSSQKFIDNIRPQYVVFTGIAGNNSNRHEPNSPESYPALEVVNNIFKYTDRIYIPSMAEYNENSEKTIVDYYGDINVQYIYGQGINVKCAKNIDSATNEPILIQDTEWFKKYRKSQINVFALSSFSNESTCLLGNSTLVKYGHFDILIDCGNYILNNVSQINSTVYLDKIKKLCVDNTLEYLIVSSPNTYSLQQLTTKNANTTSEKQGVLSAFKIENIIDFGNIPNPINGFDRSLYACYQKEKEKLIKNGTNYFSSSQLVNKDLSVTNDLSIDVLHNDYYGAKQNSDICLTVNFRENRFLFLGNNRKEALDNVSKYANEGINNLSNVVLMQIPTNGEIEAFSKNLYNTVYNKTKDITLISNSVLNENFFDRERFTKDFCDDLIFNKKRHNNLYVSSEAYDNNGRKKYREICGDIQFSVFYQENYDKNNASNFSYNVDCSTKNLTLIERTEYYKLL